MKPHKTNLLPWRSWQRQHCIHQGRKIMLINIAFLLLLNIFLHAALQQILTTQQQHNRQIQQQLTELQKKRNQISPLPMLSTTNESRRDNEAFLLTWLAQLPQLLPIHGFVTQIKQEENILLVTGKADQQHVVFAFIQRVKEQPLFAKIKLLNLQKAGEQYAFTVAVTL